MQQCCLGTNENEVIVISTGENIWGHQDARSSLVAITDETGNINEYYTYSPFGLPKIWAANGVHQLEQSSKRIMPIFGCHQYIGLEGLFDARARIYDARTGQFLQLDPRGNVDSANRYSYVANNPVDLIDPSGEVLPIIAAAVIIGAFVGVGYSAYDAYHHPERYQGSFSWRTFFQVAGGAAIFGLAAVTWEAVLASGGVGAFTSSGTFLGTGSTLATSGALSYLQPIALYGTAGATSGLVWRTGFNYLFPEYVDPPSSGTMAFDYAFSGLGFGMANRFAGSLPTWQNLRVVENIKTGFGHARRGPWRLWSNKWKLITNPRTKYKWHNLFWDPRPYRNVGSQYWWQNPGHRAAGNSLQHIWVKNSTRWVPEGFRNCGLNLVEIPLGLNRWMGGRPAREITFRLIVGSGLITTFTGSYLVTESQMPNQVVIPFIFGPSSGVQPSNIITNQNIPSGLGVSTK